MMASMRCARRFPKLLSSFTKSYQGQNQALLARSICLDISGIFPPITTPFNNNETQTVAYDKLEENIKKMNEIPFKGFVVQGSNGEFVFLTDEERVEMVKRVRDLACEDKLVIAGSGCESTAATMDMTQKMACAGADAVMVVTPCYFKGSMTSKALIAHYTKVANASPVPVILYSVPSNTSLDLPLDVIDKMASHENVIGIKDSGGDISKIGQICYITRDRDFQVLVGSASLLVPALAVGCVGGILGLANILGDQTIKVMDLFKNCCIKEARDLQQKLIAPNNFVTKRMGVPAMKAAMDQVGLYGGPPRLPLQPLTEDEVEDLKKTFRDNGYM